MVTTHDWAEPADVDHLTSVCRDAACCAVSGLEHRSAGGVGHALDEAAEGVTSHLGVVLRLDGSLGVVDDGRGTDRLDLARRRHLMDGAETTASIRLRDA